MPAPYSIDDFVLAIPAVLQDSANKLYPAPGSDVTLTDVLTPFIARAIERYSKDRPLEIVSDIASNGSTDLDLPVAPAPLMAVFDPLFSRILSMEWPIDQQPSECIDETDFVLYRKPGGYTIRLFADTPAIDDIVRTTWTARHLADGSTVPNRDFYAIVDFAASLAAEQLATIYAQTSDPVFNADVVNYRSKSQEYQGLAKMLRRRYYNHVGVDESTTGAAEVGPALAIGQQYENMQSGVSRLIHNKYTR